MTGWISVEDSLPELHTNVLCNVKNHAGKSIQLVLMREYKTHDGLVGWLANFIFKTQYKEYEDEMPEIPQSMITHWMPLPSPPKDSK